MLLLQIILFIGTILSILIGQRLYNYFGLSRYYILPQTVAVPLLLVFSCALEIFSGKPISFNSRFIELLGVIFLWVVGVNVGKKISFRDIFGDLIPLALYILFVFALLHILTVNSSSALGFIFNPLRIGWSADSIVYLKVLFGTVPILGFLNSTIVLTFIMTPIALRVFGRAFKLRPKERQISLSLNMKSLAIALMLGIVIYVVTKGRFNFIYPSTFSFVIGLAVGKIFGERGYWLGDNLEGMLGLLTVVIVTSSLKYMPLLIKVREGRTILYFSLMYIITLFILHWIMALLMKKSKKGFIYISACWALLCTNPLGSMNAMKSAGQEEGEMSTFRVVPVLVNLLINLYHLGYLYLAL